MQGMVIRLRAYVDRYKFVARCAFRRLATCNEIWTRPANSVLDNVGQKRRQGVAYEESEDGNMGLMNAQAQYGSPCKDNQAWYETSIDQVPLHRYPLDARVWIGFRAVIEGEHAMEGFDEELYQKVGGL